MRSAIVLATCVFAATVATGAPPTAAAAEEILIVNSVVYRGNYGDLNKCIGLNPTSDIRIQNLTRRTVTVFADSHCAGSPTARVSPGMTSTYRGASIRVQ